MKVDVYSRRNVVDQKPDPERCLISIWSLCALGSQGYEDNIPMEGWHDSLRLDFDDVTHDQSGMFFPFNDEQGKMTFDFMNKNLGHDFVIHCDAGFSRSVAMGAFMAQAHGYDPTYHECGHDGMRNTHVFGILRRIWREIHN
jgi:predicted protein tyrosine phosphatase